MSMESLDTNIIAKDLFLFGAPGAEINEANELVLSEAGIACTGLAAGYWLENHPYVNNIVSLAGFPGYRQGMTEPPAGQREAIESEKLLVADGVEPKAIKGPRTGRYAHSTIDEVCMAVEEGHLDPQAYEPTFPLGVVISTPGHGLRAGDALQKVGFDKRSLLVMSPANKSPFIERAARIAYQAFVLGGPSVIEPAALRHREERFMRVAGSVLR